MVVYFFKYVRIWPTSVKVCSGKKFITRESAKHFKNTNRQKFILRNLMSFCIARFIYKKPKKLEKIFSLVKKLNKKNVAVLATFQG